MNKNRDLFNFNLGTGENIPEWAQGVICVSVLGVLAFFALKTPDLKPTGKMQTVAETILHGNIALKSKALWELHNAKPDKAALLTNILIDIIDDETPVAAEIAQKYHERNQKLAGSFAGFYTPKTITVGDLAAFSLRRIKQNLIIETSGDGGPTTTLVAVRKAIATKVVPMLRSKNKIVRVRILKEILLGDSDPSPIDTVISSCLGDADVSIRAYSAGLFITYAHVDKKSTLVAVPKLIDLLNDSDLRVRHIAHTVLKTISENDFGTDADAWRKWLYSQQ